MKHKYSIKGMTCQNCKTQITTLLGNIPGISKVDVILEEASAEILMTRHVGLNELKNFLPDKYTISDFQHDTISFSESPTEKSKLEQLRPLFLILTYLIIASILMHRTSLNLQEIMVDFMGLFFIVFGFFKLLDIEGFAMTFSMYDPISKVVPIYAKLYPIVETFLGLMFLFRYKIEVALIVTIIILGFTTFGVTKTLLSKRSIKCACLGTALNLPMTEATFIENTLMIMMALVMLFNLV